MNALHILFSKGWGGLERYAIEQARRIAARGHNIIFLTRENTPAAKELKAASGLHSIEMNPVKYIDLSAILKIRSIAKNAPADVVHVHHSADLGLASPALWNMPSVRLIFSNYMQVPGPKKDLYHRLEYGRVNLLLTGSDYMLKNNLEYLPVSRDKAQALPYGLDMERFDPAKAKKGELRKKYKIGEDKILIGVISRLDPLKGQMEMIGAMPAVLQRHPQALLILTGGETPELAGQVKPALEDKVKQLGLSDSVIFTGETNDTSTILADLDVYVLPSHSETFSLGCLEAMAMGKAVIGTDAGGTPEMLDYGRLGMLAAPKSPEALSENVIKMLNDEPMRLALGLKAREATLAKYDIRKVIDRLEAIYLG